MQENNKSYRIHTGIGSDSPNVINVPLQQTFDTFEILTLKLDQTNAYNFYESSYGVIVGRVLANDAFGIPNAKVSIFIPVEDGETLATKGIYPFTSIRSADANGVRYNLLPDEAISACYQNVGTFPNKRLVLDNNDVLEVFDKYWKYTTVTNEAGDYMLFGIPTGDQLLHVDVDLSDIGVLSQRPRDMTYKGYNDSLFESPNKFKQSNNLDSLAQIYAQNKGVYVYPYWGDTSNTEDTIAITRCDIQLEYKFEPTCIFIGSIVTDSGSNAIGKSCLATEGCGRMDNLVTGEGTIEMIRKTLDNKVEEFQIKGNRLIDGDGVWCYQIPMNLDYVKTDEYGNIVPTDNPDKGIPTRTRVRFRVSLDDLQTDSDARKRCKFLIPNNPRIDEDTFPIFTKTKEVDYEFGSMTREESYKDLLWNKVYTVKSYIPRFQKNESAKNKRHAGIKAVNYYNNSNPFPYNNMLIKFTFTYRVICVLTKMIIYIIGFLNQVLSIIGWLPCKIVNIKIAGWRPFKFAKKAIPRCIKLDSEFCDDGVNKITYFPGCTGCVMDLTREYHVEHKTGGDGMLYKQIKFSETEESELMTCVTNSLAEENDCIHFNFENDWINGCLYAPLWQRKITPKKKFLFGLFTRKAKDQWCSAERKFGNLQLAQFCALNKTNLSSERYASFNSKSSNVTPRTASGNVGCENKCYENNFRQDLNYGVILTRTNFNGQTIYYYKAAQYEQSLNNNKGDVLLIYPTDIILLGSLNDCDMDGLPQFFKSVEPSTFKLPETILFTDNEVQNILNDDGSFKEQEYTSFTEMTGRDWGNVNKQDQCGRPDGGLFYGIGCNKIDVSKKSCVNLMRVCEFGVTLDETKYIENLNNNDDEDYDANLLIPDGFVSYDELYNIDERSMFATLNSNNLRTMLDKKTGLYKYDLRYLYPSNFDGSLYNDMEERQNGCSKTYRYNYNLEQFSRDYYIFRMGEIPFFYDSSGKFPRYENSFYFYFGLNSGNTAIDKFNKQFFSSCENSLGEMISMVPDVTPNSWCTDGNNLTWDGYMKLDMTGIATPYSIVITSPNDTQVYYAIEGLQNEKIYFKRLEAEDDDENFNGYEYIQKDKDGNPIVLENTTYTITATDSDGNTVENEISMNGKYLSFSTFVENFDEPNNVLDSDYGDTCDVASYQMNSITLNYLQDAESGDIIDKTNPVLLNDRNIGGIIGIYDLYYNNEMLFGKYGFIIEMVSITEDYSYHAKYTAYENGTFNDDGSQCSRTYKYSGLTYNGGNQYFVFGVPRGGITYRVTITQFCNGNPAEVTGNTVYKDVTVGEPVPYKLFINDVDYDVIKKGFNATGWRASGDSGSPSISFGGDFSDAWLHISDTSNISDNNPYYDWNQNEIYTLVYYQKNGYDGFDSAEDARDSARLDFIAAMKEVFYVTCPSDKKTITVQVQTDDYPIDLRIIYRDEIESTEDDTINVLASCDTSVTETATISNIGIPTITNVENKDYGSDRIIEGNICYAKDVTARDRIGCRGDSEYKHPYYVAVVNSKGRTKPVEVARNGIDGDEASGYTLDGDVNNYFGFHLIDKSFRLNQMAWAYINDIPYYLPGEEHENDERIGLAINMNGLLAGIITNGSSTSTNRYAQFETQLFNNQELIIETTTLSGGRPNEDAIPTYRLITGPHSNDIEYVNYNGVSTKTNTNPQYASVPNMQTTVNLEDENGCQINETVYGNMRISISSSSIHDCKNGGNTELKVSAVNGDGDETYYIVNHNDHPFILNNIQYTNDRFVYNANAYYTPDNPNDIDYDYMRYESERDILNSIKDNSIRSEIPSEDDENEYQESKGYGTTGKFTSINNKPVYIIAVTENNCRCISPVLDFSDITVSLVVLKQTTMTKGSGTGTTTGGEGGGETEEGGEGGGETGGETEEGGETVDVETETPVTVYKLGIKVLGINNLYYLKNYSYTAEFTCSLSDDNNITGIIINEKDDELTGEDSKTAYFEITEDVYNLILESMQSISASLILRSKTTVLLEDYTGLTHNCIISRNGISIVVDIDSEGNRKETVSTISPTIF